MDNDQLSVCGKMNVQLNAVTLPGCAAECRKGILGNRLLPVVQPAVGIVDAAEYGFLPLAQPLADAVLLLLQS